MAIEIRTHSATGTNSILQRIGTGSDILNHNSAYTVMFRLFVPDATPVWDIPYVAGNVSGTTLVKDVDRAKMNSTGIVSANQSIGTTAGPFVTSTVDLVTGWYSLVLTRSGDFLTMMIRPGTGTLTSWSTPTAFSVAARPPSLQEWIFGSGVNGENMAKGAKVMNYKSWTRALTQAQCEAEDLKVDVQDNSGLFSVSPMVDETTLAPNLEASGAAVNWAAGSGLIAGTNDPAVTLSEGPVVSKKGRFVFATLSGPVFG